MMKFIVLFYFSGFFHSTIAATNYFVSSSGSDQASGNSQTPFQTIQKGISVLAAGDSLVIRDGNYGGSNNAITNVPNGTAALPITIRAETEGNVIITAGLNLAHTNAHLIFQGLRFQDTNGRTILGNHIKFYRNEFKGGCATGNCANTQVGTNDYSDTSDILFEDNWWHGTGGRYNILVYNSNRIIIRRGVIRHDGGWTDSKGDPEAAINFYNSSNCSAQNVLVVDNTLTYHTWQGSFYSVYNSASPNSTLNNSYYGNVVFKDTNGYGFRLDGNGPLTGFIVQDMVLWDTLGATMCSGSCSVSGLTMNRMTIGSVTKNLASNGVMQWGSSFSGNIANLVVTGAASDFSNLSATYFNSYNNSSTASGIGKVTYSPFSNGLRYLTRIEAGTPLKTSGTNGGQIGAQIITRIGTNGSLHGETGWNTDSGIALWPFPNEARIKKEMCADAGISRGFCSTTSITAYIMNALGNGNPYSDSGSATLAPPTNLHVVK